MVCVLKIDYREAGIFHQKDRYVYASRQESKVCLSIAHYSLNVHII